MLVGIVDGCCGSPVAPRHAVAVLVVEFLAGIRILQNRSGGGDDVRGLRVVEVAVGNLQPVVAEVSDNARRKFRREPVVDAGVGIGEGIAQIDFLPVFLLDGIDDGERVRAEMV